MVKKREEHTSVSTFFHLAVGELSRRGGAEFFQYTEYGRCFIYAGGIFPVTSWLYGTASSQSNITSTLESSNS